MKKESFLYIAILIPVFMIVVTTFAVLWSERDLQPEQDFLYLASEAYLGFYCAEQIKFELLPHQPAPKATQPDCEKVRIYRYDFKTKTSTQLTRAEVAKFKLSPVSADNYKIEADAGNGADFIWPLIGGTYYPDLDLSKGKYHKKLNIEGDPALRNAYSLQFLAWIDK